MERTPSFTPATRGKKRGSTGLLVFAVFGFLATLPFLFRVAFPYFKMDRANFGAYGDYFWPRRFELIAHIATGTIPLLIGPLQLWFGERMQRMGLHRVLGRIYVGSIAVSCSLAMYLSITSPNGGAYAMGLFGGAIAWGLTTGMAVVAILYQNIQQHREWMIRSYVLTFSGFVVFRVLVAGLEALSVWGIGRDGHIQRVTFSVWASWAFPILLMEVALQWKKLATSSPSLALNQPQHEQPQY
jgi:uncharacterized membrane protein